MKKKIIASLLAAMLVLGTIGCGNQGGGQESGSQGTGERQQHGGRGAEPCHG